MNSFNKVIKYLAFAFFFLLFCVALYQKFDLIVNHEFVEGIFKDGNVFIKDENDSPQKVEVFYANEYKNDEVVSIFYNTEDKNGVIFEFDKFFRDILLLVLINGLCLVMIILDRIKPTV